MMGSWKSTVGKKLSNTLNMNFIDTDDAIEQIMSMSVSEIFKEFGELRFREMESSYFIEKSKQDGFVFSTGGGIILNDINRKTLKNNGITFLLTSPIKKLADRIRNTTKRPLINNVDNIEKKLNNLWRERKTHYISSAHYIIETENLKPANIVDNIINIVNFRND